MIPRTIKIPAGVLDGTPAGPASPPSSAEDGEPVVPIQDEIGDIVTDEDGQAIFED